MHPAVVTAVLLLVCILDTVTGQGLCENPWALCVMRYPEKSCGKGWSRIDANRCARYFWVPKTFSDAQERCNAKGANLVSIHSNDEMMNLICLTLRTSSDYQTIWIGAERSEDGFKYTDGSEFRYTRWHPHEPNNSGGQENCVQSNIIEWGLWKTASCSEERHYVCAKEM